MNKRLEQALFWFGGVTAVIMLALPVDAFYFSASRIIDTLAVLGKFRNRLEPRLKQAGIKIKWQVNELRTLSDFGPEKALQVMRIIQEAVTNIIKHANASTLTVSVREIRGEHGGPAIEIQCRVDDAGISPQRILGRGIQNMQRRAIQLDGKLYVDALNNGGTAVTLGLPLINPSPS